MTTQLSPACYFFSSEINNLRCGRGSSTMALLTISYRECSNEKKFKMVNLNTLNTFSDISVGFTFWSTLYSLKGTMLGVPCTREPTWEQRTVWVKKYPLRFSDIFSQTVGNFWTIFIHTYYTFLSTLDYKFLFNYLQLWLSYAILSAITQFTSYAQCPLSAETHAFRCLRKSLHDSFVDCCLWQVITDLLQCTF